MKNFRLLPFWGLIGMAVILGRGKILERFLCHRHRERKITPGGIDVGVAKPVLDDGDGVPALNGV